MRIKNLPLLQRSTTPAVLLAAFLQRTPVVETEFNLARYALESPIGSLLKAVAVPLAALGAVDSLAGASTSTAYMVTDITLPAQAAVGSTFKMDVTVTGTAVTYAKSWDVSNTLPPGLTVVGATLVNNLWVINDATATSGVLTISGIPTTTGQYPITLNAYQNTYQNTKVAGSITTGTTTITINTATVGQTGPTITTQPVSQTVNQGSSVSLSVVATGTMPLTYQWQLNGSNIAGATSATYTIASAQPSNAGTYTVLVGSSVGSAASKSVQLTVTPVASPLAFDAQPSSQTIASGSTVVFNATASGSSAPTYQWFLNGNAIPSATHAILEITAATAANAGTYTCVATNASGSLQSNAALLTVADTNNVGRLVNLSCRAAVGTGGNILITGFAVGGPGTSGQVPLLVRASGPALGAFGVTGTLQDPKLQLYQSATLLASDTGWQGASAVTTAAAAVGAFSWGSLATPDSALLQTLPSGAFTAEVLGSSGDTGVALAEVYDTRPAASYTPAEARLVNLSTRVQVGTGGNILIAGFAIGGTTSRTVLVRASGPALTGFGVTGALSDPSLKLTNQANGAVIATNSGWGGDATIASNATSVGAFSWGPVATPDSAILITLAPGTYTVEVSGASGDTGIALVEVYEVP